MSKRGTQRTRGNLKPTSSTKASATLLNQGISSFALFSGELNMSNVIDDFGPENDVDPDLRVILRKLTKKDSTTKIRAFDELRDYCDANESDEKIKTLLPFFVSHYRKWSTDSDQRVRDECQSTFSTIGLRMKKNLSPHLKTILPSWLMAQCDSYAPAASKAKFLYEKLFVGNVKQADVVYFARQEIMTALTNEIDECSTALKDKKENEMETDDAHERRLTQVLLALALFLNYFDKEKRSELTENFKVIFDSGKFWKLDKIKSIQIQSSFYRCLFELISLIPDVIGDYKGKIIPLIFNGINETEPKLSPLIWDCLILCLNTFDDCWNYVHHQQSFLPKLYAFLRHACHGNVFGVKDYLLPLVKKLPQNLRSSNFIENFFQSLEDGLLSIKGRQQMNNVSSLLKADLDCLLYILDDDQNETQRLTFLNERLMPLIRLFLTDKDCSIRNVFARQYVHFLGSINSFELYRDHLNSILNLFSDLIDSTSIDSKYFFEQSILLFETILSPPKLKNLRFAASSTTDVSSNDSMTFEKSQDEKDVYRIRFASELCRRVFHSSNCLTFEFRSNFFTHLLLSLPTNQREIIIDLTQNESISKTPEKFFIDFARPLIKTSIERHQSLDELIELTIQILDEFQSSEQIVEGILAELVQLESSRRFYFLLTSIVCRYETSPSFHTWLQRHGVLEKLLEMTATVSKTNEWNFPVSTEEFQLLSSLLCSSKPTQYLTDLQQEQIVYLACRLFEEQTASRNDSDGSRDLFQSIDHVGKHLFQNIDRTYSNASTRKLFQLYLDEDIKNVIRKNVELSQHQRSIWTIALQQAKRVEKQLIEDLTRSLLSNVQFQFDNDTWIDALISIASENVDLAKILTDQCFQRVKLNEKSVRQSWIPGVVQGWLLPDPNLDLTVADDLSTDGERWIFVQFLCLFLVRQNETNCLICSNDELIRELILNYYFFQSRCFDVKHLFHFFERLFRLGSCRLEFQFVFDSSSKFFSDLVSYHFYVQLKERYLHLNQRDDLIDYTMILNNNDELNLHLFLASFFRESQLKLILPNLIEQCQDERRSALSLAALNQCLSRLNKFGLILDEKMIDEIRQILIKTSTSSKELREILQLWNTFLNHSTVINTLEHEQWDHLLCFIGNLFQNLTNVEQQVDRQLTLNSEFLFLHASNLLTTIGKFLNNEQQENQDLAEEWLLVYSKEIYQGLLPLYIALPNALAEFTLFYSTNEMIQSICSAICTIPTEYLLSNALRPLFHSDDHQSTLPESIQTVFNHLYRLMCQCSNRSLQYSAFHLLNKLLPHIAQTLIHQETKTDETIVEDNQICRLPGAMLEALHRTEELIGQISNENDLVEEHLLDDDGHEILSISTSMSASSPTVNRDKEQIVLSEFLNYKLLLNFIPCFKNAEQRYTYTLMLQQMNLVNRFLCIALTFIPANPVYNDPISMQISSITKKLSHSKSMFENEIQLNPSGDLMSPYTIHHLACSVYIQCLSLIPALVREWYHNQKKRIRDAVDRVTQKYVSPILIQQELDSISNIKSTQGNETGSFAVKKHSNTREITAIYTIETSRVEICIRLPSNFPLNVANIECTNHIGFTKDQWSQWMLQLKTNLTQNNGAIVDGLLHWKQNIDKKMQGIEECSICYCILHTNNDLPRRLCRTCKKKFHDACLFRWFRSSNKSTCPHCRANF